MKHHNSSTRRRFIALAVAAVALLAVPLGAAPAFAGPASSPVAKYVALGDSYGAGQGAGSLLDPADPCLRTDSGYAAQLNNVTSVNADWKKINLVRQPACSGATIQDVMDFQLGSLNKGTTLVTVTAGANDLDLTGITAACAAALSTLDTATCTAAINGVTPEDLMAVGAGMAQLVNAIHQRSPHATVVVTSYVEPISPRFINTLPDGLKSLAVEINAAVGTLNATLASAAGQSKARFALVAFPDANLFLGGGEPYLGFDLQNAPANFMHPTAEGYAVYTQAILAALQ